MLCGPRTVDPMGCGASQPLADQHVDRGLGRIGALLNLLASSLHPYWNAY